jgi:hypothetical protein
MLAAGVYLWGGRAIEDPSAHNVTLAVWWLAIFSLLLIPGMRRSMGTMSPAARRTQWQRLLLYFAVGVSLFGLAAVLLSTESVVLWVIASALLLVSLLWSVYGLRLLAYGRISSIEPADGGSSPP